MTMKDKTVLVTGANRGIGRALADEALARGAGRVYAGTRRPLTHPDDRVTPLELDVTSTAQIQAAADRIESLDLLINNAGIALPDDLTDSAVLERHLAVNLFGTWAVTRAFLPAVTRSRGAVVNILSANSLAPLPFVIPAYSVSKAAAFSMTQSLRAQVAVRSAGGAHWELDGSRGVTGREPEPPAVSCCPRRWPTGSGCRSGCATEPRHPSPGWSSRCTAGSAARTGR